MPIENEKTNFPINPYLLEFVVSEEDVNHDGINNNIPVREK